ncbi:MAG: LacI family transcriptional regulator [Puniceicoccaceae bacterium 5H]|nr:MAG: LacI family transcriptional regulator [Puniceicoccaceae bacterium 5H]
MGYRPSSAASALAQMRHTTQVRAQHGAIAWLNFWTDPAMLRHLDEFDQYYQGAAEAAEKFGFRLYEFSCGNGMRPQRLQSILKARGIDGVLLPPHREARNMDGFDWNEFSIIKFGHSLQTPVGHTVSSDQLFNGMLGFREMRKRGYRRIGFAMTANDYWLFDAGYIKAQLEVPPDERLPILYLEDGKLEQNKQALKRWLDENQPDSIFSSSAEVPQLLSELGCRVPADIPVAVTSVLDGHADAGINQNPREIGRVAVLQLLTLIHDNDRGPKELYREILVKGSWVDGASLPYARKRCSA